MQATPPGSMVIGHSLTICDTVWTIPHLHLSEDVRNHVCRYEAKRPLPVLKQFSAHHIEQEKSKPGCWTTVSVNTESISMWQFAFSSLTLFTGHTGICRVKVAQQMPRFQVRRPYLLWSNCSKKLLIKQKLKMVCYGSFDH